MSCSFEDLSSTGSLALTRSGSATPAGQAVHSFRDAKVASPPPPIFRNVRLSIGSDWRSTFRITPSTEFLSEAENFSSIHAGVPPLDSEEYGQPGHRRNLNSNDANAPKLFEQ